MCSYGVHNIGRYVSKFTGRDIRDQVFDNPAGRFDYDQLISQARNQTYIVNELMTELMMSSATAETAQAIFSTYLPDEILPTTDFLTEPAPDGPSNTNNNNGRATESVVLLKHLILFLGFTVGTILI